MGLDDKVVVVTGGCGLRPAFLHQRRNPCVSLSLCVNLLRCTADNKQGCGVPSIFVAVVLLTPLSDSPGAVKTKFELVITLKAAKQVGFYNFSQRVGASGQSDWLGVSREA